jgi:hypothetical protein
MGRRFDISCIGGLIYHGYGIQNIMGGVFEILWDISFKILPSQIYSFGDNYPLYNYFINLYFKISLTVFFQTPEFQFYTTAITSPVISELPNSLQANVTAMVRYK